MKLYRLGLVLLMVLLVWGCPTQVVSPPHDEQDDTEVAPPPPPPPPRQVARRGAEKVVRERFPQCFEEPRVGAVTGMKCSYDPETDEWRITLWRGSGDCAAGCIDKEDYTWYLVTPDGRVIEEKPPQTKPHPQPQPHPQHPQHPNRPETGSRQVNEQSCSRENECFFYECCQSRPMSKRWRENHWRELHLDGPKAEQCNLKCMHEFAPPDSRAACVYHECMAVDRNAPPVDPDRPVVWIGKPIVVPQCEDPAVYLSNLAPNGPPVLVRSAAPGVKPGPKFEAWVKSEDKRRRHHDAKAFQCQACNVCKTIARVYMLVYLDDLDKFTSRQNPWHRVDE